MRAISNVHMGRRFPTPVNFSHINIASTVQDCGCVILRKLDFLFAGRTLPCRHCGAYILEYIYLYIYMFEKLQQDESRVQSAGYSELSAFECLPFPGTLRSDTSVTRVTN